MARRSGLGRGLGSLIPTEVQRADRPTGLLEVPVGSIRPNRHQPRQSFDEDTLASLTASISEIGVLQPVLLRPGGMEAGDPVYELIAGERRWRAAKRAGLSSIPAILRDVDDLASMEQAVVENLHRRDLNPLEEAAAYQQLLEDFKLTHEQLAKRVGKSRQTVTNFLRLFQLPPSIQKHVRDGQLSGSHAKALLGTPDRAYQEALARRAIDEGLSVRAVEEAVRHGADGPRAPDATVALPGVDVPVPGPVSPAAEPAPGLEPEGEGEPDRRPEAETATGTPLGPQRHAASGPRPLREPGLYELEELLGTLLETRVSVDLGAKKGRVVIEFADLDDLERIYRAMTGVT